MSSQGNFSADEAASTSLSSAPSRVLAQQSQLDFELDFFEAVLQRNPDFVDVLRVHGNNLTLKGRYADTSIWIEGQRRWVWLKGCVRTQAQSRSLEGLARSIDDVEAVINQLEIKRR